MNENDYDRKAAFDRLCANFDALEAAYPTEEKTESHAGLVCIDLYDEAQAGTDDEEEDERTLPRAEKIARLNDRFRSENLTLNHRSVPGRLCLFPAVSALDESAQTEILKMIAEVRHFPANAPERDLGYVVHPTHGRVEWNIQLVQSEYEHSAPEHPDDPEKSFRLMIVAFPDE